MRMQPEESVSQNSRQFVHPFLGRHFRRVKKIQHQLSDGVVLDWDCSGGWDVRHGMFGWFSHGPATHTRVPEILKFEVSIARSAPLVIFSKSRSIVRRNRLRKPDSLFQFRGEVCTGNHSIRREWLTTAPHQTRDWMFGPEHGSGRHGTHNPRTPMPRPPKPDQMTPAERNAEVADILARAFLRLRFPNPAPARVAEPPIPPQPEEQPCKQN